MITTRHLPGLVLTLAAALAWPVLWHGAKPEEETFTITHPAGRSR